MLKALQSSQYYFALLSSVGNRKRSGEWRSKNNNQIKKKQKFRVSNYENENQKRKLKKKNSKVFTQTKRHIKWVVGCKNDKIRKQKNQKRKFFFV